MFLNSIHERDWNFLEDSCNTFVPHRKFLKHNGVTMPIIQQKWHFFMSSEITTYWSSHCKINENDFQKQVRSEKSWQIWIFDKLNFTTWLSDWEYHIEAQNH